MHEKVLCSGQFWTSEPLVHFRAGYYIPHVLGTLSHLRYILAMRRCLHKLAACHWVQCLEFVWTWTDTTVSKCSRCNCFGLRPNLITLFASAQMNRTKWGNEPPFKKHQKTN